MRQFLASAAAISCLAGAASATLVEVNIYGTVEYNQIRFGPLDRAIVPSGSSVAIRFVLDSNAFMNDPDGLPTRGYFIDPSTFTATFGGVTVGMQNPYTDGMPMFVLRDNDPAVDGFFFSTGTAYPSPLATTEPGQLGPFGVNFKVTYENEPLSSLDILGAIGTYGYGGLTSFNFTTDDGGNDAMGLEFGSMTIAAIPAPATLGMLIPLAFVRRRR